MVPHRAIVGLRFDVSTFLHFSVDWRSRGLFYCPKGYLKALAAARDAAEAEKESSKLDASTTGTADEPYTVPDWAELLCIHPEPTEPQKKKPKEDYWEV